MDSYFADEIAEMRMLSTIAAIAGAKVPTLTSTREFIAKLVVERKMREATSAASEAAVQAAKAAEAELGGPS